MPTIINHSGFDMSSGTRVLLLKGRYKDGVTNQRTITRVTHGVEEWNRKLSELVEEVLQPGERIYGTAGQRDMQKAIRLFKERQLSADYDQDTEAFYRKINARWSSCLMAETSQSLKTWLFDCDDIEQVIRVHGFLIREDIPFHRYQTKNGTHYIVQPFNRSILDEDLRTILHSNALALLVY